jgi:hypothetical protein
MPEVTWVKASGGTRAVISKGINKTVLRFTNVKRESTVVLTSVRQQTIQMSLLRQQHFN